MRLRSRRKLPVRTNHTNPSNNQSSSKYANEHLRRGLQAREAAQQRSAKQRSNQHRSRRESEQPSQSSRDRPAKHGEVTEAPEISNSPPQRCDSSPESDQCDACDDPLPTQARYCWWCGVRQQPSTDRRSIAQEVTEDLQHRDMHPLSCGSEFGTTRQGSFQEGECGDEWSAQRRASPTSMRIGDGEAIIQVSNITGPVTISHVERAPDQAEAPAVGSENNAATRSPQAAVTEGDAIRRPPADDTNPSRKASAISTMSSTKPDNKGANTEPSGNANVGVTTQAENRHIPMPRNTTPERAVGSESESVGIPSSSTGPAKSSTILKSTAGMVTSGAAIATGVGVLATSLRQLLRPILSINGLGSLPITSRSMVAAAATIVGTALVTGSITAIAAALKKAGDSDRIEHRVETPNKPKPRRPFVVETLSPKPGTKDLPDEKAPRTGRQAAEQQATESD